MKNIVLFLAALCCFLKVHGDLSWSLPTAISTALTDASDPQVVIDANNNATAAWVENGRIKSRVLPSGGSWSSPVTLSNPLNTASNPLLALDSFGNVTAVWLENSKIVSSLLPFGGLWGLASLLSGSGASNAVLAADSNGQVVAVWERSGYIESSTRVLGLWSLVSVISSSNSSNPQVAVSDSGIAVAAWHTVVSGDDVITTNTLNLSSNTWGISQNVFSGVASILNNYPKIAMDNIGNAYVAWFQYNLVNSAFENVQLFVSSLTSTSTSWSTPTALSDSGLRDPADLTIRIAFNENNDGFIVWTNSTDGQTFSIEASQKLYGTPWQQFLLLQIPSIYSFGIALAVADNTALLTNMAWDGVSDIVILSQQSDSFAPDQQFWTDPIPFSTGSDNGYPKCTLASNNTTLSAVAVWIHNNGSNNVIHASTGVDLVVIPPSNVSATQSVTDFGVYQDYYNTITWDASTDPTVVQYNIYRNGVLFAGVDSSTLQYIDHNQVQDGTVTYGVAALTSEFRVSPLATFTLN